MRVLPEDPQLLELGGREVVRVECQCGRIQQIAPFRLIGMKWITRHTRVSELKKKLTCTNCKKRPKMVTVGRWQD